MDVHGGQPEKDGLTGLDADRPLLDVPEERIPSQQGLLGPEAIGIADRTGSITPGKRADLVLVRITDTNMAPACEPYEAMVSLGLPTNVDTVIVDGRVLRRAGTFTAFDHAKIVAEAREAAVGLRDKAKWPT